MHPSRFGGDLTRHGGGQRKRERSSTTVSSPEIRAIGTTLDANDPELLADFWQRVIGFKTRIGDGNPYITLSDSGVGRPLNHLTIQRVPEGKSAKHRLHLDLFVTDDTAAVAALL